MGTSVSETEDLISVLDNDVTELDALVSTLWEENAQLQLTVNLLLERMDAVEAAANSTNTTLDGKKMLSFTDQGSASTSPYEVTDSITNHTISLFLFPYTLYYYIWSFLFGTALLTSFFFLHRQVS